MSTRQLTDVSQNITDGYTYDAFGILLDKFGATENNYLYTGEQYDPNIGFYYLRARYYNASIGWFLTMDNWPGSPFEAYSLHKYLYCNINPVNNWDPSGHLPQLLIQAVLYVVFASFLISIGAISYTSACHILYRAKTPVIWKGSWRTYSINALFGIRVITAEFEGEQRLDNIILKGEGVYTIYLAGAYIGPFPYEKSESSTSCQLITPGLFGPNPLVLAGPAVYYALSQLGPLMPGMRDVVGASIYYLLMGMGKPEAFKDMFGVYKGFDQGAEITNGISIKNYGKGPY